MKKTFAILAVVFVFASQSALAVDDGQTQPKMNTAINSSHTTPTDLIPLTNGSGNVKGILCVLTESFTQTYASPVVKFYVDGGSAQSVTFDSDYAETHTVAGGNFRYTDWVPFNVRFGSSIKVTIQKNAIGGSTIQCQASWALD